MKTPRFDTSQMPFRPSDALSRREALSLRTDSSGCIALPLAPLEILDVLAGLPTVYIQVAHAYGRFVARYRRRAVVPIPGGCRIGAALGRVDIGFSEIRSIYATVGNCPCCGSPGEVVFMNAHGLALLRVCADRSIPVMQWGQALSCCLSMTASPVPMGDSVPVPWMSAAASEVSRPAWEIVEFLESVAAAGLQAQIELPLSGALHRQELVLEAAYRADGKLIVQGSGYGLELGVFRRHHLCVEDDPSVGPRLSLISEDGIRLFSISSSSAESGNSLFAYLLSVWLKTGGHAF